MARSLLACCAGTLLLLSSQPACWNYHGSSEPPGEDDCGDLVDNDGDGDVDCEDPDCADHVDCQPADCDHDGICDEQESCAYCSDCCEACGPGEGTAHDYIVTRLDIPRSAAEGLEIGVDLNGDGTIDNQLGSVFGLFPEAVADRLAERHRQKIDSGELILLPRLWVDTWPSDGASASQLLLGLADPSFDATEDNFTGTGHVLLAFEADRSAFLCGELTGVGYDAGPGPTVLPIPLMGGISILEVQMARTSCTSPLTRESITDMQAGGGVTRTTVENQVMPALQVMLNEETLTDPDGETAQSVLAWVDSNCNTSIAGCESVTPGQGDCAPWDHLETTLPVSFAEIRCNFFINSALAPDLDSNGDQVNDLMSIGFRYSAVHITIDN